MFSHYCEILFLELVSGDFLGGMGLFGTPYLSCSLNFFNFYLQLVSVVFWRVKEII